MEERRSSPERYRGADPKVSTINPYSKLLSSSKTSRPSMAATYQESPNQLTSYTKSIGIKTEVYSPTKHLASVTERDSSPIRVGEIRSIGDVVAISPSKYLPNFSPAKNTESLVPLDSEKRIYFFGARIKEH